MKGKTATKLDQFFSIFSQNTEKKAWYQGTCIEFKGNEAKKTRTNKNRYSLTPK